MQLLGNKFLGYWVLETVMLSLAKVQVNMRDVERVVLYVIAVDGQHVIGLLWGGSAACVQLLGRKVMGYWGL